MPIKAPKPIPAVDHDSDHSCPVISVRAAHFFITTTVTIIILFTPPSPASPPPRNTTLFHHNPNDTPRFTPALNLGSRPPSLHPLCGESLVPNLRTSTTRGNGFPPLLLVSRPLTYLPSISNSISSSSQGNRTDHDGFARIPLTMPLLLSSQSPVGLDEASSAYIYATHQSCPHFPWLHHNPLTLSLIQTWVP